MQESRTHLDWVKFKKYELFNWIKKQTVYA